MIPAARTVTLPVRPGASWDDFAWDPKRPADILGYVLDCADWLDDAGRVIESATLSVSAGLTVVGSDYGLTGNAKTSVLIQLAGGAPLTVQQVLIVLTLDDGGELSVLVMLPIRSGPPTGLLPYVPLEIALSVGGTVITVGSVPIVIPGSGYENVSVRGSPITIAGNSIVI